MLADHIADLAERRAEQHEALAAPRRGDRIDHRLGRADVVVDDLDNFADVYSPAGLILEPALPFLYNYISFSNETNATLFNPWKAGLD